MKPLRSSERMALSASGSFFVRYAAESGRLSSMRSTAATGSSGPASSSNCRAASQPGVGERINFARTDFARERQHGAQHLAQRRAVIAGDPARRAKAASASSTGSASISRSASRAAICGGSSWQRRATPVILRTPNGTITRQPGFTRCRSVSGSE